MKPIYIKATSISRQVLASERWEPAESLGVLTIKFTTRLTVEDMDEWTTAFRQGVYVKRDVVEEEIVPAIFSEYEELQRAYELLKKANLDLQERYNQLKEKADGK